MDEEDLAELRESQKLVDEHEEMDFGGTAAEKGIQGGVAEDQECVYSQFVDLCCRLTHQTQPYSLSSCRLPCAPTEGLHRCEDPEEDGMEIGTRHRPPLDVRSAESAGRGFPGPR